MVRYKKSSDQLIAFAILLSEMAITILALLILFYSYRGHELMNTPNCKRIIMLSSLIYVAASAFGRSRIHNRFVRGDQLLRNTLNTLTVYTILMSIAMWAFRWPLMTWHFMLPFNVAIWLSILFYRWTLRHIIKQMRRNGRNSITTLFVGDVNIILPMYTRMRNDSSTGYRVKGYFDAKPHNELKKKDYLGTVDEALEYIRKHGKEIHNVYCMLPTEQNKLINELMLECDAQMVRYYHVPYSFNYQRHTMSFDLVEGVPVFAIRNEPLAEWGNRFIKRAFDIVFSLVFLLTLFPIIYVIFGTLIKLTSPGPIFFLQKRSGFEGKEFWCLKFRSMKVNDESDNVQATKNDPRKTRLGNFMRRTNIDEMPQFLNVLRGDMSVVGPRPHMLKHTEQYSELIRTYMVRHYAKPGITGHAQVTGFRGETHELWQMEERVKKDIWYIEHWTLALDILIILKTVTNAIRGEEKAY